MGCLRLTYGENESPLRVSRDEEITTLNWQVWVGEKGVKKVKGCGDQTSGGGSNDQSIFDYLSDHFYTEVDASLTLGAQFAANIKVLAVEKCKVL